MEIDGRTIGDSSEIIAALYRLEAELGSGEYLVGDSFSVADLSAASLFLPPSSAGGGTGAHRRTACRRHGELPPPLEDRRGYHWVEETFRKHRWAADAAIAS